MAYVWFEREGEWIAQVTDELDLAVYHLTSTNTNWDWEIRHRSTGMMSYDYTASIWGADACATLDEAKAVAEAIFERGPDLDRPREWN